MVEWLTNYGYKNNQTVMNKLIWYAQLSFLNQITKYYENLDLDNVNREIYALRNFRSKYGKEAWELETVKVQPNY